MENGESRLKQTQAEVEEVKEIMLDNLNKAEERTGKLGELEDRAEQLLEMSKGFEKTTNKLKQKKRCEAMKMKILLGGIAVVVVLAIIIAVISVMVPSSGPQNSNQVTTPNTTTSVKTQQR